MRLFYCLELPKSTQTRLDQIAQLLHATDARVTWVRAENFHITLKFLGDVEPAMVDNLRALGAELSHKTPKCELRFDSIGAFPDLRRPRVLWIGSRATPQVVIGMQKELDRTLLTMGFTAERHFSPHVTVGRVKEENSARLAQLAQLFTQIKSFDFRAPITNLTLMESQLTPNGSIYTPFSSWQFLD